MAISGSLRQLSTNTALLQALVLIAPPTFKVLLFEGLSQIPPFNPDVEDTRPDAPVNTLRTAIREAGVVIFSTPEYAHGIPGSLKNALDWIVGSGELSRKPVVLLNASSRATYAQAALREVLTTMDARLLADAEATIDLQGKKRSAEEMIQDAIIAAGLNSFLQNLALSDIFLKDV